MARIKDVAQEANVSIATVSRVINNIPLVNEETRLRVLAAIKKTGYKPNVAARSLKMQKSNIIGVMINDITRPVMSRCLAAIQKELSANGYSTIVAYTKNSNMTQTEFLDMFIFRQCDGIIFIGTNLDAETISTVKAENVPAISCLVITDDGELAGVGIDEYEASKTIVKYLVDKGHTKIGAFMGNDMFPLVPKRIQGFIDAMKEYDLQLNEDWIIRNPMTFDGGYSCATSISKLPKEKLPTAIYCFNDDMAIGAMKAFFYEGRILVPEDISIISMNGSVYADWNFVSVTSLKPDPDEIGRQAADILLEMCRTGKITNEVIHIPTSMSEGASVKDLRK